MLAGYSCCVALLLCLAAVRSTSGRPHHPHDGDHGQVLNPADLSDTSSTAVPHVRPAYANLKVVPATGQRVVDGLYDGCLAPTRYETIRTFYGPAYADQLVSDNLINRKAAAAETDSDVADLLWRAAMDADEEMFRIPYEIQPSFLPSERESIVAWLHALETATAVVKFTPRAPSDPDWVAITHDSGGGGCWTSLGRDGGAQVLNLDRESGCVNIGVVMHEALHVLGLPHEHSRADRDQFVTISPENIEPGLERQLRKADIIESSLGSAPYDTSSIMHFPATAFSASGQETITALDGSDTGQWDNGATDMDAIRIRLLYQCASGPRSLSEYNEEPCTADCKCGLGMMGCGAADELCKGSLVCQADTCVEQAGEHP